MTNQIYDGLFAVVNLFRTMMSSIDGSFLAVGGTLLIFIACVLNVLAL